MSHDPDLERWLVERLTTHLGARSEPEAFTAKALWPAISAWFLEPAPQVAEPDDWLMLEVAYRPGDDDDAYAMDPPDGLDPDAPWFYLTFQRNPSLPVDGGRVGHRGIDLCFAPSPALLAMLDDPKWDTGNLLGFDCLGLAGPAARDFIDQAPVRAIIDAFGDQIPAAVTRFGGVDDDVRLV